MTSPYGYGRASRPIAIHGPKGYVRDVMAYPSPRGAVLRVNHTRDPKAALHLCTTDAAEKMTAAIAAHFPLTETGYAIVRIEEGEAES